MNMQQDWLAVQQATTGEMIRVHSHKTLANQEGLLQCSSSLESNNVAHALTINQMRRRTCDPFPFLF